MKENVIKLLKKAGIKDPNVEIPSEKNLGDYSFPCFSLAKEYKKNPAEIAKEIKDKLKSDKFEKIETVGPYINFFIDRKYLAKEIIEKKQSQKKSKEKIIIEMSSPNIAKPFHVGHLRSTIIGNSISEIAKAKGIKVTKINFLGDWGTQFGKLIVGFKKFGSEKKLKEDPIKHLLEIYVKANKEEYEPEAREWFKKLEQNNKEAKGYWKKFRELSLKEFDQIYKKLGISFDVISGESEYNKKMEEVFNTLKKKKLIEQDQGAWIVDLKKHNLGIALIKKSDGATLYLTRDIAAAIDRYEKYKFTKMIYEVGAEQKLHFQQLFKILELMGHSWAKNCVHVDHGLYLDEDGKKFATRKGKAVFMEDILKETIDLAKKEIKKRSNPKDLEKRASKIAIAAILYGDLKNFRSNNIIFDLNRFVSFEGDTGPYLLYSYARAKSVLKKAKQAKLKIENISDKEKELLIQISKFDDAVEETYKNLSPNIIANYSYDLARKFNEFYHEHQIINSEEESFRLELVKVFSETLKNSLNLLGIETTEEM